MRMIDLVQGQVNPIDAPRPAAAGSPADAPMVPRRPTGRPTPRLALRLALLWGGLVLYGGLLPFELRPGVTGPSLGELWPWLVERFTAPSWPSGATGRSSLGLSVQAVDLLTNLAILVPVGFFGRLHLRAQRRGRVVQWLVPALACLGLSWCIEAGQSLLAGRFSSLADVRHNTIGGLIGAAIAPWVMDTARSAAFSCYCLLNPPCQRLRERWLGLCRSPRVVAALASLNLLILGGWIANAWRAHGRSTPIALPFERLFQDSYDEAAIQFARTLTTYGLVALFIWLQFQWRPTRRASVALVGGLALLALGRQVAKRGGAWARVDTTEMLIAMLAGVLVVVAVAAATHAVRSSCRRRAAIPVRYERRRARFDYAAAV